MAADAHQEGANGLYSDLYGAEDDISGDDPFQVDFDQLRESTAPVAVSEASSSESVKNLGNDRPTEPSSTSPSKQSESVSYSAQIAMQFSSYNQTPSQERLVRPAAIPTFGTESSTGTIASFESRTPNITKIGQVKPSDMKEEGKMFIGGLSWDTTDEGLNKYFSQFGQIDASIILRDPEGKSRGFAFLTFVDPASVFKVLAQDHVLDGKSIDPKRAIPRMSHRRSQRFFVGGLSPTSTGESLKAFFGDFGQVIDINIMMDRETRRNKGYAFVTYEDLPEYEVSRITDGSWEIDGRIVEIKLATPRPTKRLPVDRDSQNGSGLSKIGTYTSDSPPSRSSSTAPVSMVRSMVNGGQQGQPQPPLQLHQQQQQNMSALYQRMMGRMGSMMANANPGMMFNGPGNMNMRNMSGMTNMGMGGMGMGMNMGAMGMGNPGMMNGGMMPGAMGGGMGMGMGMMGMTPNMNPMMRGGAGAGGMTGMGFGVINPQAAMAMGGNTMMSNPQMQMSAMNSNMQPGGGGGASGTPALRLGSGPLTSGTGVGGNNNSNNSNNAARIGGGPGRGKGGVGPQRTGRGGHFHPYSR